MSVRVDALTEWIRETAAPASKLLIPVSGGSDSALIFWLCQRAYPEKAIAIHAGHELQSRAWFESIGPVEYVDTPGEHSEREEMRWARFLSRSLALSAWLVGSRNRTEDLLGTYSLSSGVASVLPLVGTWKSAVLEMCAEIGMPAEIIASSLRADPDCGRPEALSAIPYALVEVFLKVQTGEAPPEILESCTAAQVSYLDGIYRQNGFKRTIPSRGPLA
jgi:NH3-dependent NAD+ synthetase